MLRSTFLNKFSPFILISVLLISISPVESKQYPLLCGQTWTVQPVCMKFPISSQSDFDNCKDEVEQYFNALDYHLECTANSFTSYMNDMVERVKTHVICVNNYMEQKRQNASASTCPPLEKIYFMPSKVGLFTHENWKTPYVFINRYCYEETEYSNDDAESLMCRAGWNSFLDFDSSSFGINAKKNAKFLHDEYIDRLIYVVKEEKELIVGCFNSWARNMYFSSSCP